jgi:hypothetical protein
LGKPVAILQDRGELSASVKVNFLQRLSVSSDNTVNAFAFRVEDITVKGEVM